MPQRIYTERRKEEGVGADTLRACVRAGEVKKGGRVAAGVVHPLFGA